MADDDLDPLRPREVGEFGHALRLTDIGTSTRPGDLKLPHSLTLRSSVDEVRRHLYEVQTLKQKNDQQLDMVIRNNIKTIRKQLSHRSPPSESMSPTFYQTSRVRLQFSHEVLRHPAERSDLYSPLLCLPNEILSKILIVLENDAVEMMEIPNVIPGETPCAMRDYKGWAPMSLPSPTRSLSVGAGALALTCKLFAKLAQSLRVTKTIGLVRLMTWDRDTRFFCACCFRIRAGDRAYWDADFSPDTDWLMRNPEVSETYGLGIRTFAGYLHDEYEIRVQKAVPEGEHNQDSQWLDDFPFLCPGCFGSALWLHMVANERLWLRTDSLKHLNRRRIALADMRVLESALPEG